MWWRRTIWPTSDGFQDLARGRHRQMTRTLLILQCKADIVSGTQAGIAFVACIWIRQRVKATLIKYYALGKDSRLSRKPEWDREPSYFLRNNWGGGVPPLFKTLSSSSVNNLLWLLEPYTPATLFLVVFKWFANCACSSLFCVYCGWTWLVFPTGMKQSLLKCPLKLK